MMRIKQGIFVSVLCGLVGGSIGACAWGDGSDPGGPGNTGTAAAVCGDGTCETSEIGACASDCGNSGSGSGSNNNGSGSGSGSATACGNAVCEANLGEDATTCPADCTGGGSGSGAALNCSDQNVLLACFACTAGLGCTPPYTTTACAPCTGGTGACGDGTCDAAAGETTATCPLDCP